ncbi:MAG TPA: hypothetical protein PK639_04090 [Candidatus Woesebacteria bacterium]|nr:hypothetical protein [Candidatus Woesebacteria bacterium]
MEKDKNVFQEIPEYENFAKKFVSEEALSLIRDGNGLIEMGFEPDSDSFMRYRQAAGQLRNNWNNRPNVVLEVYDLVSFLGNFDGDGTSEGIDFMDNVVEPLVEIRNKIRGVLG